MNVGPDAGTGLARNPFIHAQVLLDGGNAFECMVNFFAVAEHVLDLLVEVVELSTYGLQLRMDGVQLMLDFVEAPVDGVEALVVLVQSVMHTAELVEHQPGEALKIGLRHMNGSIARQP